MKSLVANGMHYIRNGDGREELYDYERDPSESHDLGTESNGQQLLGRYRTMLADLLRHDASPTDRGR